MEKTIVGRVICKLESISSLAIFSRNWPIVFLPQLCGQLMYTIYIQVDSNVALPDKEDLSQVLKKD